MNKYDSEKLKGILANRGMEEAPGPAEADVILLNTCSIREKAEQKVFSRIGRLAGYKKRNNSLLIAVGGCMATLRGDEIFRRAPAVDIVFGPDSIKRLPDLIDSCRTTRKKCIDVELDGGPVWDSPEQSVRPSGVSAWVGVMKGCDNHCSYCVVPTTRGPEVSRRPDSIISEVKQLASQGCKEINLLGQNVNSYGKSLEPKADFTSLLRLVDEVDGIERIRFMTSHPKDLTDGLIEVMATARKLSPSLHLPVQAGSDRILRMMGRGYTAAQYLEKVNRLKKAIPGITISTDIMVGFPTESEEEFRETLRVMEEVLFDSIYLFIYSPRPGTAAAGYNGALPRAVASERFNRAKTLNYKTVTRKNRLLVGQTVEVLCEGLYNDADSNGKDQGKFWFGRTPGNHQVVFYSNRDCMGETTTVSVVGLKGYNLKGKIK
jgi:tRNA-2-methylthio-N6-dimethylallyladenosine synthase